MMLYGQFTVLNFIYKYIPNILIKTMKNIKFILFLIFFKNVTQAFASPGFFGERGTPKPLKGSHALPTGGQEAAAILMVTKMKILKRMKVLEYESILKNFNIFLLGNPFL